MQLTDKIVVVTGAGSGIGREVTLALTRRGSRVAAVDLREDGLAETADLADAGERVSMHAVDVSDRAAVDALPSEVIAAHGAVDAVIHCAGIIQPFVRVHELEWDVLDRVLRVDLYGTLHVVRAFLPHLLDRPEAHLATVSSMGGFLPVPGQTVYGAAKAAVKLLTEGLYAELMDTHVRVSVVLPGAIATPIGANSGVTMVGPSIEEAEAAGMALSASEAARILLAGIEADKLHILVGRDAKLMYAASRLAPEWATRMIQRRMKDLLQSDD